MQHACKGWGNSHKTLIWKIKVARSLKGPWCALVIIHTFCEQLSLFGCYVVSLGKLPKFRKIVVHSCPASSSPSRLSFFLDVLTPKNKGLLYSKLREVTQSTGVQFRSLSSSAALLKESQISQMLWSIQWHLNWRSTCLEVSEEHH